MKTKTKEILKEQRLFPVHLHRSVLIAAVRALSSIYLSNKLQKQARDEFEKKIKSWKNKDIIRAIDDILFIEVRLKELIKDQKIKA